MLNSIKATTLAVRNLNYNQYQPKTIFTLLKKTRSTITTVWPGYTVNGWRGLRHLLFTAHLRTFFHINLDTKSLSA